MTYSLINKCAKNYYNRTFIVPVIAKNVVTCFFLRHSVYSCVIIIIKSIWQLYCVRKFIVLAVIGLEGSLLHWFQATALPRNSPGHPGQVLPCMKYNLVPGDLRSTEFRFLF